MILHTQHIVLSKNHYHYSGDNESYFITALIKFQKALHSMHNMLFMKDFHKYPNTSANQ